MENTTQMMDINNRMSKAEMSKIFLNNLEISNNRIDKMEKAIFKAIDYLVTSDVKAPRVVVDILGKGIK